MVCISSEWECGGLGIYGAPADFQMVIEKGLNAAETTHEHITRAMYTAARNLLSAERLRSCVNKGWLAFGTGGVYGMHKGLRMGVCHIYCFIAVVFNCTIADHTIHNSDNGAAASIGFRISAVLVARSKSNMQYMRVYISQAYGYPLAVYTR